VPGPAALLRLVEESRAHHPFTVQDLKASNGHRLPGEEGNRHEYGLALVKTAASLAYTIRLCCRHQLEAVTDSVFHFRLLDRTRVRDRLPLIHRLVPREEE
jgi:hypothetical protein